MLDRNTLHIVIDPSQAVAGSRVVVNAIQNIDSSSHRMSININNAMNAAAGGVSSLSNAFGGLATKVAAFSLIGVKVFNDFAGEIMRVDRIYNGFIAMMTVTTGDISKSRQEFEYIATVANMYGVSLEGLTKSYAKLAASTTDIVSTNTTKQVFEAITMVSTVMHAEQHTVERMFNAIIQIASKGQVHMEELKQQLGEHLPGALALAAVGIDKTVGEMIDMMKKGEFSAKMFLETFPQTLKARFEDAATVASESMFANMSRLRNQIFMLFRDMATNGVSSGFSEVFRALTDFLATNNPAFVQFADIVHDTSIIVADFIKNISPDDVDSFTNSAYNAAKTVAYLAEVFITQVLPAIFDATRLFIALTGGVTESEAELYNINQSDLSDLSNALQVIVGNALTVLDALRLVGLTLGMLAAQAASIGNAGAMASVHESYTNDVKNLVAASDGRRAALNNDVTIREGYVKKIEELEARKKEIEGDRYDGTNPFKIMGQAFADNELEGIVSGLAEARDALTRFDNQNKLFTDRIQSANGETVHSFSKVKDIFDSMKAGTMTQAEAVSELQRRIDNNTISAEYGARTLQRINVEAARSNKDSQIGRAHV